MHQSKLLELISKIPIEELDRVLDFVQSPFFNKGKDAQYHVALFEHIKIFCSDFDSESLSKEEVALKLFLSNDKAQLDRLNKIMSGLNKLIEEYIIYTTSGLDKKAKSNDQTKRSLLLLSFYLENNLNNKFELLIKDLQDNQNQININDKKYLFYQFEIEYAKFRDENFKNKGKGNLNIPNTLKYLDWHYFLIRLELSNLLLTQNRFISIDFKEHNQLKQLIPFVQSFEDELPPIVRISLEVTKLLNTYTNINTESSVEVIISHLQKNKSTLPLEFINDINVFIRNYFTFLYNNGKNEVLSILFDFQLYQLKEGYLFYDNKITSSAFFSIVNNGLKLKKFDWVNNFLKDFESSILGDEDNALFQFNLENYYFHIKEFDKIHVSLTYPYKDIIYLLATRRLEIKLLFEQNDFYFIDYKIKAFSQYLFNNREKISEVIISANNAFLSMVKKLVSISDKMLNKRNNGTFCSKILKNQEAVKSSVVAEKEWILEQLDKFYELTEK